MKQIASPFQFFADRSGDPLDAGYIYIGAVNQNPETTPIAVYWDEAGTQPAAQPLRTSGGYIVNGSKRSRVFVSEAGGGYSITVKDKAGALVESEPDVPLDTLVVTPFAETLLNDASAEEMRATLGIPDAVSRYDTGEIVLSAKTTAPDGTVPLTGGTIGNEFSFATIRANADTSALFTLLWNGTNNTDYPIQNSIGTPTTRGSSAAADFSANKRFPLPNIENGDALIAAVSSAVLTRSVGELISHTHSVTDPGHTHTTVDSYRTLGGGIAFGGIGGNMGDNNAINGATTGISIQSTGGTKNKSAGLFVRVYMGL